MLISKIVGLDTRVTMDMDATLRRIPLSEERVIDVIREISETRIDDGVVFEIVPIEPIRKDDAYGG